MAFKLTKAERAQRDDLVSALEIVSTPVVTAIDKANEQIAAILATVNAAISDYNEVLAKTREFTGNVASRLREEIDGHSYKWQRGERGAAADTMTSAWENIDLEQIDSVEIDAIDDFDPTHRNEMEKLPDESD